MEKSVSEVDQTCKEQAKPNESVYLVGYFPLPVTPHGWSSYQSTEDHLTRRWFVPATSCYLLTSASAYDIWMMEIQNPIIDHWRDSMPRKLLTWQNEKNLPILFTSSYRFLDRYIIDHHRIIGSEDTKKNTSFQKKLAHCAPKVRTLLLFNQEKKTRRRSGQRVSSRKYHTHFNCIDHCLLCSFDTSTLSASFCLVRICEEGKGGVKGSGSAPRVQNEVGSTYAAS